MSVPAIDLCRHHGDMAENGWTAAELRAALARQREEVNAAGNHRPTSPPALWLVERLFKRSFVVVALAVAVGLVVEQVASWGPQLQDWDWLKVSGFVTWLAAFYFPLVLPDRMDMALERLDHTKVIEGPLALGELRDVIHGKAKHAAVIGAVVVPVVLTLAFAVALQGDLAAKWILLAEEAVAAVPVGFFVGRACSYSRLGRRLEKLNFKINPDPGHLDGAAGLRPVGSLFLYQATLLAIPAAFLAAWWVLIPLVDTRYLLWRDSYAGLLAFVVACEILAFFVPMLAFHRIMLNTKQRLFEDADRLSDKIASARRAAASNADSPASVDVEAALARYQAIERMPTWPVDTQLRRRFGIRNLILLAPVVAQALGAGKGTQNLLERLQKLFSGA